MIRQLRESRPKQKNILSTKSLTFPNPVSSKLIYWNPSAPLPFLLAFQLLPTYYLSFSLPPLPSICPSLHWQRFYGFRDKHDLRSYSFSFFFIFCITVIFSFFCLILLFSTLLTTVLQLLLPHSFSSSPCLHSLLPFLLPILIPLFLLSITFFCSLHSISSTSYLSSFLPLAPLHISCPILPSAPPASPLLYLPIFLFSL